MKTLLINPPRFNEIIGNNPSIIEKERGCNPPLGLLYLAAVLEQQGRHQVTVIDAQVEALTYAELERRIAALQPDVVGVTAMTLTLLDVVETARVAKRSAPKATVVLGGPHVHLYPDETIRLPNIDFLVLGEAEEAFVRLLDHLGETTQLRQIPGLVFELEGQVVDTGPQPAIKELDRIPFPARHLVPYQRYRSLLSQGDMVTTLFTSRGCPYQCSFCDRPHLGKRFRARSAQNVVDEIQACVRMGITEFLVYDDTFTVSRRRVKEICDQIVARRLEVSFDIRARVDTVDDEVLAKLKRAGCQGIHYGIESGSPHVLERLNKGITLEQVEDAFARTRRVGIQTLAYFMIGNPGERLEDIQATFRYTARLRADYVHLTILTPFPGTQIYNEALQSGLLARDVWREFARDPRPDFEPPHWGEHFTRTELNELLVQGYRRFYLRPSYIARRLMKLRSRGELIKKARAGLRVLTMSTTPAADQRDDHGGRDATQAQDRQRRRSRRYRLQHRTHELLRSITGFASALLVRRGDRSREGEGRR